MNRLALSTANCLPPVPVSRQYQEPTPFRTTGLSDRGTEVEEMKKAMPGSVVSVASCLKMGPMGTADHAEHAETQTRQPVLLQGRRQKTEDGRQETWGSAG